ncbi:MAG: hypothetical protein K2W92_02915 [Alphaproteobacteria bacterium]|nr:hypothetical protein [Alphaproteobacteria bacterium]
MRNYKLHLKIKNNVVSTHEIDMHKSTYKNLMKLFDEIKSKIPKEEGINNSVSLVSDIAFTVEKQNFNNMNEIYVNSEPLFIIFSKLILRMKNDFTANEEIRIHEEGFLINEKIEKTLKRIERYTGNVDKNEKTVNVCSIKSQNRHLSMRRNLEYIVKLKEMGEETKNHSLSELSAMIDFNKTHSSLRYVLDLAGIEYRKYR